MNPSANINVRLSTDGDRDAIAALLVELQEHYGANHPGADAIRGALSSVPGGVEFALALTQDGGAVGLAAFSAIYPGPNLTGGVFLKELYVSADARSGGVGALIMAFLARLATERGLNRIDWTVGTDNTVAIGFYDRLGGTALRDRLFYRLNGPALTALARTGTIDDEPKDA